MSGYYLENFGCRATQADAAAVQLGLEARGLRPVAPEEADLVVVNTCTVTASADSQARQAIRAFHRKNPRARIVVCGCYAQRAPEELAEIEGVSWVVGNARQAEIVSIACGEGSVTHARGLVAIAPFGAAHSAGRARSAPEGHEAGILTDGLADYREVLVGPVEPGLGGHTRPTLKIQDGCNHRCAYCVIPQVRGCSRSLAPEGVIAEIRRLVGIGAREVVLSGINLGGYGRDLAPRLSLGDLIEEILARTSLERLRLSSLEPMHLTADLVERMAASERIAPHFHIPLQSGSDRILHAMHRWYRAEHYARRIEWIHQRMPDAAIGADAIAGFPGETDADHRATLDLVARLPFSYLHVFSFSPRPGTEAVRLGGAVSQERIRARARELRALTLQTIRDGATDALTANYLTVGVPGVWKPNLWLNLRLRQREDGSLAADPVEAAA